MTASVRTFLHQKDDPWKVKVGADPKLIQKIFICDLKHSFLWLENRILPSFLSLIFIIEKIKKNSELKSQVYEWLRQNCNRKGCGTRHGVTFCYTLFFWKLKWPNRQVSRLSIAFGKWKAIAIPNVIEVRHKSATKL